MSGSMRPGWGLRGPSNRPMSGSMRPGWGTIETLGDVIFSEKQQEYLVPRYLIKLHKIIPQSDCVPINTGITVIVRN